MRQTINLFIGDSLTPVCEAVTEHSKRYGEKQQNEYAHFISCTGDNGVLTFRVTGEPGKKQQTSSVSQIASLFDGIYGKTINISRPGDSVSLLVTVTLCLFKEGDIDVLKDIVKGLCACSKSIELNVIGLYSDMAELFVSLEGEKKELLNKRNQLNGLAKQNVNDILLLKKESNENANIFLRFFVFQNCNEAGVGLDLDKNTLIRILGEYAILVTDNYSDLFPAASMPSDDVTLFGMSSLSFNQFFFKELLFKKTFLYLLEREGIGKKYNNSPSELLKRAKKITDESYKLVYSYINNIDNTKSDSVIEKEFKEKLNEVDLLFTGIINDDSLSLPEKRALLAMLVREDDPLFDDSIRLNELPAMDDCMSDAIDLYVDANNEMAIPVLDGPKIDGKIYNPITELKQHLVKIRESQAYIRKEEQRLKDIEKSLKIEDDSKKLLTDDGFTYGDVTYRLQHDIVEKPLEKTYQTKKTEFPESVDLRSHFSPIRNQGMMGSCVSFSLASVFEYIINEAKSDDEFITLSPRFLYYNVCEKNDDGTPVDNGSSFYDNIKSLGDKGICEESFCKYDGNFNEAPSTEALYDAQGRRVTEAMNVKVSHDDFLSALSEGYPVAVSLKIFDSFGRNRKGFVFRPTEQEINGSDYGYHAMVICGYDKNNKVYIVRNSWGSSFGDKGYCYIPFSYVEDENLCAGAVIITGVSCADIKKTEIFAEEKTNFDLNDKDIEYSVTRIKRDEEKVYLNVLKGKYNEFYKSYMMLLADLCNKRKRQEIMNEKIAGNEAEEKTTVDVNPANTDQTAEHNHVALYFYGITAFACIALAVLSLAFAWNKSILALSCAGFVISLVLLFAKQHKKTNVQTEYVNLQTKLDRKPVAEDRMLKNKFILSGLLIDNIKQMHDELVDKHSYLVSFIRNLHQWYGEEEKSLQDDIDNERMKAPFISLLDKDSFNAFFEENKDSLTGNTWLYKMFPDYGLKEDEIKCFKEKLDSVLRSEVGKSYKIFSMSKYLMQSDSFQYLKNSDQNGSSRLMEKVAQMSLPFGEVLGKPTTEIFKCILIKTADKTERKQWENFLKSVYSDLPSEGEISSPLKLIYVQIHEVKSGDLKIMQKTNCED